MLLRAIPLQQPTGPLQLRPRALGVATPWSLGLLDLDTHLTVVVFAAPAKCFQVHLRVRHRVTRPEWPKRGSEHRGPPPYSRTGILV